MLEIGNLKLYDVLDLVKLLRLHEKTIRAILRSGKLKGKKLAKRWYVKEEDLQAYFETNE